MDRASAQSSDMNAGQVHAGRGCQLKGEHSADQGPPGDGADDTVDGDGRDVLVECLLEAADGGVSLGPEDPVDLHALARVPRLVAELELLLEPADGGVGGGSEDAVHGEVVTAGLQQVLQGLDGMVLVILADERPWADR